MLGDARMASKRKLQRGVETTDERRLGGRVAASYGSEVWGMVQCCKPDPIPSHPIDANCNGYELK